MPQRVLVCLILLLGLLVWSANAAPVGDSGHSGDDDRAIAPHTLTTSMAP